MFSVETYRFATPDDAEILLSIYRPYVESSPVTFEWTVPTAEEFRARVEKISAQYPYLVAERDGEILWIAGIAPCAPCAIGPGSRQALIIKYTRPKE